MRVIQKEFYQQVLYSDVSKFDIYRKLWRCRAECCDGSTDLPAFCACFVLIHLGAFTALQWCRFCH